MNRWDRLPRDEQLLLTLRALYDTYGYTPYKMSKFEEYDLYVRNKDFLISDSIITFTDTNGKLLALKPDVTLSIIKNGKERSGGVQKVYYDENVYRVSKGTRSFKEILQAGLECIGDIDDYCLCEVLTLAAQSLRLISPACVLDVSHLGLLSAVLDQTGADSVTRAMMLKCIGEKNGHELAAVCREAGVADDVTERLTGLVAIYGAPKTALPRVRALLDGAVDTAPLDRLEMLVAALENAGVADTVRLDFSAVSDMKYYNDIVFKGFVEGVPDSVLSGGQYDNLMKKMGKPSRAIGFAIYLDLLQRLDEDADRYDVDTVLLYDDTASVADVQAAMAKLTADGTRVTAQKAVPEKLRYRQLVQLKNGEVN